MSQCVVIGCTKEATVIAGKPTVWGAWEYWVCQPHKEDVDAGAFIDDQPDGRTIVLRPAAELTSEAVIPTQRWGTALVPTHDEPESDPRGTGVDTHQPVSPRK